jgi:phosphoenolpyruvate carboxylase
MTANIFSMNASDLERKIPVTMATQHPDNAGPSPFSGQCFVSARDEIEECYRCFSELGVDEYMWDWEGKFVDEAVIDRLYARYFDYFKGTALGRDKFLTFRIPNIWEEPTHKLPRAFVNLIAAEQAARNYGLWERPLFEVILPMTTEFQQLKYLQEKFHRIAKASEDIFETQTSLRHLELIPLFEKVETMADSVMILERYLDFFQNHYGWKPPYLRVFIARSDPAMNAGLIPTMLAVKHAISAYHQFGAEHQIQIYPWVGGGSLPFRGGIAPDRAQTVVSEYRGTASLTVQSAFRFDYPADQVRDAIAYFQKNVPLVRDQYQRVSQSEGKEIQSFNQFAAKVFAQNIEAIAPEINWIANLLPSHRERVQHIGMFGYARGVGSVQLPRAIKFCGALYSLGVPPEIIATGRVLRRANDLGFLPVIERLYENIKLDLTQAGYYLNRENLEQLGRKNSAFREIKADIEAIESYLNQELGPQDCEHFLHRNYTSNILHRALNHLPAEEDILHAAVLRRSLG